MTLPRAYIAELTTSVVRVIDIPRKLLAEFQKMPDAKQVGIYFLIGEESEGGNESVYIGQSGAMGYRLAQHNNSKDFWNRAMVVISPTNSFTQTHATYLEWMSIAAAIQAGRFSIENGNTGNKPHTPPPLQADCEEIHEVSRTLLATLGVKVFDAVAENTESGKSVELFYCTGSGASGTGGYTSEGFVVLKGSKGRLRNVSSISGTSDQRFRQNLMDEGVLVEKEGMLEFVKDKLFGSPSMAAVALLGRTANGWFEWKNAEGKTLHELKRATTPSDDGSAGKA